MTEEFAKHHKLDPKAMANMELWSLAGALLKELRRRARITGQLVAIDDRMTERGGVEVERWDVTADCGCCGSPLEGKVISRLTVVGRKKKKHVVVCRECLTAVSSGTGGGYYPGGQPECSPPQFEKVREERLADIEGEPV